MNLDPVVVHQLFGAAIAVFALLLLLHVSQITRFRSADRWPGGALIAIGALLALDPWVFHGGDFGAEGLQHVVLGTLTVTAGALELDRVYRAPDHPLLRLIVPALLATLGVGFLMHSQHAGGDMVLQLTQHRIMGVTLLLASVLKLADVYRVGAGAWASSGWLVALLALAIQLLLYAQAASEHPSH